MTTITFRRYPTKAVVCSDTQLTWYNTKHTAKKLQVLTDGSVIGLCGDALMCDKIRDWWDEGADSAECPVKDTKKDDEDEDDEGVCSGILVRPDGSAHLLVKGVHPVEVTDEFLADGSGAPYARAAMAMGAPPDEAIRQASKFDIYTNDVVDSIEIDLEKEDE